MLNNRKNSTLKLIASVMLFGITMFATFLLPFLSVFIQNSDKREIITMIIALLIISHNAIPFILQSEVIKIASGNRRIAENIPHLYDFIYTDGQYITKTLTFSGIGTIILLLLYSFILGTEQLNEMFLYSFCIFVSYSMCLLTFDKFRKKDLFMKRVFLILQPFALFSIPLCCSFYIMDTLNSSLEYISLLVVISIFLIIYYLLSNKYEKLTKPIYALTTLTIALALAFFYYGLGFTKTTIIHSNIRILMISLFYGVYLSLLYGMSYTLFYPIRTSSVSHSINKFLISLFNISPFIALPVLIFCFDSEPLIYCYIVINIVAVNLVGQIKKSVNIIFSIILILGFIITVICSIKFANDHIYDYEIDFAFDSELLSILLAIPLGYLFKNILPKFVNVNYSVLRGNRCYYITYIINSIVLVFELSLFDVYQVFENQRNLLPERPIYLYLLFSTVSVVIRTFYVLFSKNAISKKTTDISS